MTEYVMIHPRYGNTDGERIAVGRDAVKRVALAIAFCCTSFSSAVAQNPGPGVPAVTFPTGEVFTEISSLGAGLHAMSAMHDGYLVVPHEFQSFLFYEISNPYQPNLVHTLEHNDFGEGQTIGFHYEGSKYYAAVTARNGIQIWDWSNVTNPILVSELTLPGVFPSEYTRPAWWIFWQAPYIYVGSGLNGIYIINATDLNNPFLANLGLGRPNPIPPSAFGGFRVGAVNVVGNLMVAGGLDVPGLALFDLGDPLNPQLRTVDTELPIYSFVINDDRIAAAAVAVSPSRSYALYDIASLNQIELMSFLNLADRGGYVTTQDHYVHIGASSRGYYKIDISNPHASAYIGNADFIGTADADFATVAGNLLVLGDDDGAGTRIFVHQADPDTTPPRVNMVNPVPNAVAQPTTTRVGLTFSDQIDLRSVNESTFIVRQPGGLAIPGRYSGQMAMINFSPDVPFQSNKTYEIVVPIGGILDYAGNAIDTEFVSTFSTGSFIPVDCSIDTTTPSLVGESVAFDVNCSPSWQVYSWDFGDGSDPTPQSANPESQHTYTDPGHYLVILGATQGGVTQTFTTIHTVTNPTTPQQPTRTSSIIYNAARDRVWNVNPDNNSVTAIDAITLTKTFEQPVGQHPTSLAHATDDTIWIANKDDATIDILDAADGQPVEQIALPYASRPHAVVFNPAGDKAYVSLEATGILIEIDTAARTIQRQLNVGPRPRGVAVTHDGSRILVTRFISPADHGEVIEVDAASLTVTTTINLATDPGPDTDVSSRGIPNYLMSVTISPDGHRAWIPSKKDNTVRGAFVDGNPLTFETTVRTIVSQIDLDTQTEDLATRIDLNNSALASAVEFTSLGDYAFVATLGSNTVEVFDAYTLQTQAFAENVGISPMGLVLSPDNQTLFVHNYMSRDVMAISAIDLAENTIQPLEIIETVATETLEPQVLLGKQIFYNAADPRMSRDRYLSCATCHLDGGSDHRVWDFTDRGEGLRNTPTLKGRMGTAHGPVHWSANFDEIQDFEHDIRNAFEGTGLMDDADFNTGTRNTPLGEAKTGISADLDALAAYVASLTDVPASPYRNPDGSMTAGAIAGAKLFHSPAVGCASCHQTSQFTDSHLTPELFTGHDVGTITAASGGRLGVTPITTIDTPTLRGLWETAPYLHDGSATTLMDVLTTANSGDLHGVTSHLTPAERQQLVAYMLQLDNAALPDLDGDRDVDLDDFNLFAPCSSGPAVLIAPDCGPADFDGDLDADQLDFSIFQRCRTASGEPASHTCRN